jgi:hypothetical protein
MKSKEALYKKVNQYIKRIEDIDKQIAAQTSNMKVTLRKERVKLNHLKKKKMLLMRKRNLFSKKLWHVDSKQIPNKAWRKL